MPEAVAAFSIQDEVRAALDAGRAVVALETAVLTHGLPFPDSLEAMRRMQAAVAESGALPAVVAVLRGRLCVGLTEAECAALAEDRSAAKASARDLAALMVAGRQAGTTVAATLLACRLGGIRVFATGGIGGVHRGWSRHRDLSADLEELARTPTCVVCAGAKSILDLPATLEALETHGVPVIGYGTDRFPQFYSQGSDELRVPHRIDDLQQVARMCRMQWGALEQSAGVLLTNPIPQDAALPQAELDQCIEAAHARAEGAGIFGAALTPFLLDQVAQATEGRSRQANLVLLENNARLAGALAVQLAEGASERGRR